MKSVKEMESLLDPKKKPNRQSKNAIEYVKNSWNCLMSIEMMHEHLPGLFRPKTRKRLFPKRIDKICKSKRK